MVAFSSGSTGSVADSDATTPDSDGSVRTDSAADTENPEPDSSGTGNDASQPGDIGPIADGPEADVSVTARDDAVVVAVGDAEHELTRAEAADFRQAVGDAIADRRELVRTAGEFRPDGSYVVARRGADSAGNAKVFEGFAAVRSLYDRLPPEFDAEQVGAHSDVTGSRRHMLVRYFAEHPAFDCDVVCRNPLRAEKGAGTTEIPAGTTEVEAGTTESAAETTEAEAGTTETAAGTTEAEAGTTETAAGTTETAAETTEVPDGAPEGAVAEVTDD